MEYSLFPHQIELLDALKRKSNQSVYIDLHTKSHSVTELGTVSVNSRPVQELKKEPEQSN